MNVPIEVHFESERIIVKQGKQQMESSTVEAFNFRMGVKQFKNIMRGKYGGLVLPQV